MSDLGPLLQACEAFLAKASRRRLSTLQLIEPGHRQERQYQAALQHCYLVGQMDLAGIVREGCRRGRPLGQATVQAVHQAIDEIRDGMLAAADRAFPRAFTLGARHVATVLGGSKLPSARADALISRRRQKNAHFVERNLLGDLRERTTGTLQQVAGLLARVAKAEPPLEPPPTPIPGGPEERAQEIEEKRKRIVALLFGFLVVGLSLAAAQRLLKEIDRVSEDLTREEAAALFGDVIALISRRLTASQLLDLLAEYARARVASEDAGERIGTYAATLWELINLGFKSEAEAIATATGARLLVDWVTTSGDPCPDCLTLEFDAPYELNQLPTLPGAGDTVCLTHCRCYLNLVPAKEAEHGAHQRG